MTSSARPAPFVLVLSGGGARGLAHVGVLRALEAGGLSPAAVVGVSMGALVATTYALRDDWYSALLAMDTNAFPRPFRTVGIGQSPLRARLGMLFDYGRTMRDMFQGWGLGTPALFAGARLLRRLTLGRISRMAAFPGICQMTQAHLQFQEADLVLAPTFARTIDTLEFCRAPGMRGRGHESGAAKWRGVEAIAWANRLSNRLAAARWRFA